MLPRERILAALERKPVDRVPFVETTIGVGVGERLLGRETPLFSIPALGLNLRNIEDEKALSRLLHRDNISVRLLAPTFSKSVKGAGGQAFAGEGLIKSMDDFHKRFSLPDPEDPSIYEPIRHFIERKEEFTVICSTRLGFLSTLISMGFQTLMESFYLNPELVDAMMSAYVDWSAEVIRRLCDMGVDAVATTDDFAFRTGPFMSPACFRDRRASERPPQNPSFPAITSRK